MLVWHYHDDDVPGPAAAVTLNLSGLSPAREPVSLTRYLIDADHSNAYEAWLRMGSPLPLSTAQFAQLEAAGKLAAVRAPETLQVADGGLNVSFPLARQAVTLLVFERHPGAR